MADNRSPRELDTRSSNQRPTKWTPPKHLPDPTPEPGYAFRWVRLSTVGADDPMNISAKLREGWEPVKASEHPELKLVITGKQRFPDSVEYGGLLLCKIPTEFVEQRRAYYAHQTQQQMTAVDNNLMRENNPKMPLFNERKTSVSFGRGS